MFTVTELHARPLERGTTLVEVLVALLVIGVGMLGIASLYVTTLQAKTTSLSRMQAINLATDMAERIRANPGAPASYAIATGAPAAAPSVVCVQTASTSATACTAAQMAATDLFDWSARVSSTLPGTVSRSIAQAGTNPTTYTITLNWSEPAGGNLSYVLEVQI